MCASHVSKSYLMPYQCLCCDNCLGGLVRVHELGCLPFQRRHANLQGPVLVAQVYLNIGVTIAHPTYSEAVWGEKAPGFVSQRAAPHDPNQNFWFPVALLLGDGDEASRLRCSGCLERDDPLSTPSNPNRVRAQPLRTRRAFVAGRAGTAARAARRRPRRRRARRRSCPRRCTWPTSRATSTRITCARFSVRPS